MTVESENYGEQSILEQKHTEADVDIYPDRKEEKKSRNWFHKILLSEKQENISKSKCELNVLKCVKESPIIKLMVNALKSSGCEFDVSRHVSCDICDPSVSGGYDAEHNQIVICHNICRSENQVQGTLAHEMIHMFDYCRNKLDLNNLDHLACTEIRAASQCHCSFLGAMWRGTASPFHIKKAHQDCVKDKAVRSVLAVKQVSKEVAKDAVARVFDKCYNDLEPIGRHIRRKSYDMEKAYYEGPYYGYS